MCRKEPSPHPKHAPIGVKRKPLVATDKTNRLFPPDLVYTGGNGVPGYQHTGIDNSQCCADPVVQIRIRIKIRMV